MLARISRFTDCTQPTAEKKKKQEKINKGHGAGSKKIIRSGSKRKGSKKERHD